VDSISHVINFDMPDTTDAYIHRIGRTGRAKRTGDAFTLVTSDDNGMIHKLEKIMGHRLNRQTIEGFNYETSTPPHHTQTPPKAKRSKISSPHESEHRRLHRQHGT